ncbi:hypothetical protein LV476_01970 [Guyparkeria hydrothermalis]|uniref:hypothetical protein n=1 Tax=Guyparkeria hydrothermalis TaxID=923 RepID=UPI0020214248|nr:hypothetical protein [Guyparkeria hydrothermalis]MCL7743719.1 hypothetical protein [Guyparkeria hydrothermalis]
MMTYDIVNVRSNPAQWMAWQQSVFSDWDLLNTLRKAEFRASLRLEPFVPPEGKTGDSDNTRYIVPRGDALDSYREHVSSVVAPKTIQANRNGMQWLGAGIDALDITGETVAIFGSGQEADHRKALGNIVPTEDWVRMQHCMLLVPDAEEYHYWSWRAAHRQPEALIRVKPDIGFQARLLKAEKAMFDRHKEHNQANMKPANVV